MKRILLLAAAVAGAVAFSSVALAGPGDRAGGKRGGRAAAFLLHRHARHHRMAALHVLRELNLTDAQKAAIQEARTATEAARNDLRQRVRAAIQECRSGDRTKESRQAARAKVKEAVTAAVAAVEPQAKRLLDSLTSEQRAVLLRAAAARGLPADDATLVKGISRLLLRGGHRHAGK